MDHGFHYAELVLVLVALVLFFFAGIGKRPSNDFQLIPFGLFFWLLAWSLPVLRVAFAR